MRIAVIGTGYVGLVAGACFAGAGQDVTCVDMEPGRVAALRRGEMPLYEPGLEALVRRNHEAGRLRFTTDLPAAVAASQVVFIAVGTPMGASGGADLQYVLTAAGQIGRALRHYTVVVDKSTVPVGTADRVHAVIAQHTEHAFDVVSNPEFLKEGAALDDFLRPDRVIVGTRSERARQLMRELYAPFVGDGRALLFMDPRSAELTKYAANAMLATRISFMNDVATLCERVDADVEQVRQGMGLDPRIGSGFLQPGIGYGGSCFPKDVRALMATAHDVGLELDLLKAVEATNARQKRSLLTKALRHYGDLSQRTFAVWGLSFKPRTDDMREAPSVEIIEGLLTRGARVQCHDPVARDAARRCFADRVSYASTCYDAAEGADGLFLATEWSDFRHPDLRRLWRLMRQPVIFDGRNALDPEEARAAGFTYFGIGRG
ncbi:UDP-glucose/GDP-mannose dehydrogenase family protein [Corallococcus sp. ZKHCc1 1396]|uniref:UDP-glucose 6-dehydrogenase n=1 Tax=Corallococcus soli TaxID=2710757 RepID=A0ABR9PJK8_9BACT|nr:UDP-glucose/GDP-mannose dehydrogenase family protein [Corallococcus soli]MBE4748103.1 UDP-glucose/GDP-mannose dehydrogenase family protein [Corallococcus soli]